MSIYKRAKILSGESILDPTHRGWAPTSVETDFEPFEVNPEYGWDERNTRGVTADHWSIVVPRNAPPVPDALEDIMNKMINITWKRAEPQAGVVRGKAGDNARSPMFIGAHKPKAEEVKASPSYNSAYKAQVRPTGPVLDVRMGNQSPIATDWRIAADLVRTNAVTFRADKRAPYQIFSAGGFKPPNTRTDRPYLENSIWGAFSSYTRRRFNRDLTAQDKADWLISVTKEFRTGEDLEILYEYLVWKSIVDKESAHLGRMLENETLKAWTSTARCLDSSLVFATFPPSGHGWMYVVIVHAGYVVPFSKHQEDEWGTAEAEIAQYGPIPWERIVGFTHISSDKKPDTPIFLRRTFRKTEPQACEQIYNSLSGKTPPHKVG